MIYLIDDTPIEMIGEYMDPAEYGDLLVRIAEGRQEDLDRMKDADCVLLHSSYADKPFLKAVKKDICGYGETVPLVLFSDGNPQEVEFDGDNLIVSIRKDRVYSNLAAFIQAFGREGTPDLKILAYGEHYARERAASLAGRLLSRLMFQPGEEAIDPEKIAGPVLEEFVTLSAPGIGQGYDGLLAELRASPMTAAEFRSRVNKILDSFNQYDKNIYHW